MTTDWDVIVIGAGPAGSVAARQITLRGQRVLLLDKKDRKQLCELLRVLDDDDCRHD